MKLRAPADVYLRHAQVVLLLSALVTIVVTTSLGVVLLVGAGSENVALVAGILVLTFCAASVAAFVVLAVFLRRGATLVREQSHFLSLVSHELRTPMTSIRMFVEALLDDRLTDPGERRRCLGVLRHEVERLDGLVDKLIELSRIEGAAAALERRPVPVREVCEAAFASLQTLDLAAQQGTAVEIDVPADLTARGDAAALTRAVGNLLSNAWKYTGDDKHIRIAARQLDADVVELEVTDNGPGIPARERKRVFEKFMRGSAAETSNAGGSGLGLSLVRAIVAAHRGTVSVDAAPGGGARFVLRLPGSPQRAGP